MVPMERALRYAAALDDQNICQRWDETLENLSLQPWVSGQRRVFEA